MTTDEPTASAATLRTARLTLCFDTIPWPVLSDGLFREDSDWWQNARLDLGGKGWESYAYGYKNGGDILAEHFLQNCHGSDQLVFPIVFLYRHYLELRLKQVINDGQKLLDQPINIQETILERHDLIELWRPCRKILEKLGKMNFWPEDPAEKLDDVERLIKEFAGLDRESMSFRYPVTKKNKGSLPTLPNLDRIGIRNLHEVMQRLDSYFVAQVTGIDFYLQESKHP